MSWQLIFFRVVMKLENGKSYSIKDIERLGLAMVAFEKGIAEIYMGRDSIYVFEPCPDAESGGGKMLRFVGTREPCYVAEKLDF